MRKAPADRLFRLLYRVGYRLYLGFCWVFRPASRGVYVAVWHDGCVLLIRNSYKSFFTVPGGGLKNGESAVDAASRELSEEVGIGVGPDRLHLAGKYRTDYEFTRDAVSLFHVIFPERPEVSVDRREVVWAEFMKPEAALHLKLYPVIREYLEARLSVKPSGDKFPEACPLDRQKNGVSWTD